MSDPPIPGSTSQLTLRNQARVWHASGPSLQAAGPGPPIWHTQLEQSPLMIGFDWRGKEEKEQRREPNWPPLMQPRRCPAFYTLLGRELGLLSCWAQTTNSFSLLLAMGSSQLGCARHFSWPAAGSLLAQIWCVMPTCYPSPPIRAPCPTFSLRTLLPSRQPGLASLCFDQSITNPYAQSSQQSVNQLGFASLEISRAPKPPLADYLPACLSSKASALG